MKNLINIPTENNTQMVAQLSHYEVTGAAGVSMRHGFEISLSLVSVGDLPATTLTAEISPKQARVLADALVRFANVADARNAKG